MFKRLVLIAMAVTVLAATPVYAGQWMQDSVGWWWRNDDGSYPAWYWAWVDGNHDGIAENYYFDGNGYLSFDTSDQGIQVDANGAMIYNGAVCTAVLPEGRDYFPGMAIDGKLFDVTVDTSGAAEFEREREEWRQSVATQYEKDMTEDVDPCELAELVLELVNEERVKNGREPLAVNDELMEIAVMRAEESDYCAPHTRPDGSSYATAVPFSDHVGENLMNMTYGYRDLEETAKDAVDGWMNSSGHKRNILNSQWTETGVGVYIEGSKMCVIQLFIY